jgi:Holliday junction resolvase RusA-like endonuclease
MSMTFTLLGPPVAKERPRRGQSGQWYTPKRTKDYEAQVAWTAQAAGVDLDPERIYGIRIEFYLSTHRRDLDNLCKCVLDGLQQLPGGWNDRQVWSLALNVHTVRDASEEKMVVTIEDQGKMPG